MNTEPKNRGSANRSRGWRIRRWSPGAARLPATSIFRTSFICASCARRMRMAASSRSTPRRRARCPVFCGVDRSRHRRRAADRFPRGLDPGARSVSPAGAGERTACAMSAIRSPRCLPPILISPRTPPIWSRWRSRNCRRCSTRKPRRPNFRRAIRAKPRSSARAMATSTRCSATRRISSKLELAVGRHSGVPLETRGAIGRYDAARGILELHGAAKVPHRIQELLVAHARACRRAAFTSTNPMSAAASACAASFIPRTCWSASPPKNSIAR